MTRFWNVVGRKSGRNSGRAVTVRIAPWPFLVFSPGWIDTLQASANAAQYDVYLDTNAVPTTLVSAAQSGTTYNYSGLVNSKDYYWKIVANNVAGSLDATGAPWTFRTVGPSPGTFGLDAPPNSAVSQPLAGVLIMTAIVAPWLIAVQSATAGHFVSDSLAHDLLPKLVGAQEAHGAPPGFYLAVVIASFWPGSLFIVPGLMWGWRQRSLLLER